MKLKLTHRTFTAAVALAAGVALFSVEAQARGRSTTVHGRHGGVYQRQVQRTPGNFSASGSAVLPGGKSASRSLATQRTETGRTTTAQVTGFDGRQATYDSTRTKTDTGFARQVNVTRPNGGTGSKSIDVSKQSGTVTRSVTATKTLPQP